MMITRLSCNMAAFAAAAVIAAPVIAGKPITMTFEEFLGADIAPIATFYNGITFESGGSGSDWVARDGTTGAYNLSSWPSGDVLGFDGDFWIFGLVGATTALDATGNDGTIRFDNADATFVEVGYCAANEFFLEAYDAQDNLMDIDSGPANLRIGNENELGPGVLHVDWDGETPIAYVIVHDEGNYWILDNVTTDATGIIVDCNNNEIPDDVDILEGISQDCNGNGVPDECDIANGVSQDCNGNEIPDECDISGGASQDCNGNGVPDECDIAGKSQDQNRNGVPDECEPDCNGNGIPDELDIANGTSTDFNGNGIPDSCESIINFGQPQSFDAEGAPNIEATGDLDGNGTLDVVTALPGASVDVPGSAQVFVNLGNDPGSGDWLGLLPLTPPSPVGREPSGVAVGFFDSDAHLDAAVSNAGDNTVSILIGLGDGTFVLPAPTVGVGARPSAIIAGDLDEDGLTDLGVTNEDDDTVIILSGNGNGGFTPPAGPPESQFPGAFAVSGNPIALAGDDFDNNKCPDLAGGAAGSAAFGATNGTVFVLLGQGGGNYAAAVAYEIGMDPQDISTGDLNNDGCSDIVAVNAADGTVSVLINMKVGGQCTGEFFPPFAIPVGALPVSIDAQDVNGDGRRDLAVVSDPGVQVLQNMPPGPGAAAGGGPFFGPPVTFPIGAQPNFIVSGDMDGNGVFDLVTVNQAGGGNMGSVSVLLSDPLPISCEGDIDGDGYVTVPDLLAVLSALGPCAGCPEDLNGDGVVDIHDILAVINLWGPCPGPGCPFDFNGDGDVDVHDVIELLGHLGFCDDPNDCPWDLDGDGFVGPVDVVIVLLNFGPCG